MTIYTSVTVSSLLDFLSTKLYLLTILTSATSFSHFCSHNSQLRLRLSTIFKKHGLECNTFHSRVCDLLCLVSKLPRLQLHCSPLCFGKAIWRCVCVCGRRDDECVSSERRFMTANLYAGMCGKGIVCGPYELELTSEYTLESTDWTVGLLFL